MVDPVVGPEVVDRLACADGPRQPIDRGRRLVGQEHDAGLRPQLDDVPRAIVFLVAARAFVFLDQVPIVLVEREARGDAGLLVSAHSKPIAIHRRLVVLDERRVRAERGEVLPRRLVHLGGIRIGAVGQIDLGSSDVEEAQRIADGEPPGFVGVDDVVRNGRNGGGALARRPQGAKGTDNGHLLILAEDGGRRTEDGFGKA
jgi:hypothetical protein